MEEHSKVVIDIEDSFSSGTTGLYKFSVMLKLKHTVCSPLFLLIILCTTTSTITIFVYTSMFLRCIIAFPLLVRFAYVFSRLIISALIFCIERQFVMKTDKALYFVFALKTSMEYFCSLSILLSAWFLYIRPDMTTLVTKFLVKFVTSTLSTSVIATATWMLKIVVLKVLDCRFHDSNFFHNMQDLISHEYVLQTLLRPTRGPIGIFSDMLFDSARLHTICDAIENSNFEDQHLVENYMLMVFKNLTNDEHPRNINETDLLRVMKREDLANVIQLFEGASQTKRITEASLRKWMVKVCNERKIVVQSLNYTSNVIKQLNKIILVILSIMVALAWCLLMGFGTTTFLVFIPSHLLLFLFYSGDNCKTICEGIFLAIVIHPFNRGDHCVIDNEQLIVEETGLITTSFLKENNEKVNHLNSALLTKSISNLNRSSKLRDNFEILVSNTTSFEAIAALKLKINEVLGSNPEIWHADHCFDLKGIENVTNIYNLQISYAAHFQKHEEMNYQRSELVLKLRKLLEELDIKNYTIQQPQLS